MVSSPSEAFGQAIREVRAELRLSQEEAALKGGIDRAYFGHIERATKNPTLPTIWKIARALQVKPSELMTRTEQILEGT